MPSWSPSAWSHAPKRLKERFWWERKCHGLDELVQRGIAQSFRWLLSPVSPVGTNTCSSHGSSEDQCSYLLSLSSSLREVHVLSTIPEALLKPINLFCTATTRLLSTMPDKKQNKLHSNLWMPIGWKCRAEVDSHTHVGVLQMHAHTGTLTHMHTNIFFIRLRTDLDCLSVSILPYYK